MQAIFALVRLVRPWQWAKNLFVFTALVFSGQFVVWDSWERTLVAFAAFCAVSSAVYCWNDWRDVDHDRAHPNKRHRPLASGALPLWVAPVAMAALVLAAAAAVYGAALPGGVTAILLVYGLLNAFYSLGLKQVVILDVMLIAAGFVLRVLAGAAALSLMPSTWLALCAVTVSLFLGFTKRRAEMTAWGSDAIAHRAVLGRYSVAFLDQAIAVVTAATLVCYALYTVDDRTVHLVGSRMMFATVPVVAYGLFRYLLLVYRTNEGEDPTRAVFTDVPMLATGVLWAASCMGIMRWGREVASVIDVLWGR